MTVMTGDEKHGPSATSTLDVLWVLYDQVLRVSPDRLEDPGRDRFLLSKGHGPAAYHAVLARGQQSLVLAGGAGAFGGLCSWGSWLRGAAVPLFVCATAG